MSSECVNIITKNLPDLSAKEAKEIVSALVKKVEHDKKVGQAAGTAENQATILSEASAEIIDDLVTASFIQKRNAAFNIFAENNAMAFANSFQNKGIGWNSFLVGVSSNIKGSKASIDAQHKAIFKKWVGGMLYELEQKGLVKHLNSKEYEIDIARALWALDTDGNVSGLKKQAVEIAKIVKIAQDAAVAQQNSVGAWIKKIPGYITRQSHDSLRIRSAGFESWKTTVIAHLDHDMTFKNLTPGERAEFLKGTYDALSSGIHLKTKGFRVGDDAREMNWTGPGNLARRVSEDRVLHFKSADDWFAYNQKFGTQSLIDSIIFGLEHSSRNVALMKNLGTNPEAMKAKIMKRLIDENRNDVETVKKLRSHQSEAYWREVDGSSRIPGNQTLATGGAIIRAINNMAKLGSATLSAITDVPFHAAELRYQGHGLLKAYSNAFDGVMRGRSGIQRREIADLLGVGFDGMLGTILSRFGALDTLPGTAAKLQQGFFRLNLLSWWTDSQKTAAGLMMSKHLHQQKTKTYGELDDSLRRILSLYNIEEKEWNLIRSMPDTVEGHITPDVVRHLTDESVMEALGVVAKPATGIKFYKGDLTATGEKATEGTNPGGFYKDKFGNEYYMKILDDKVARNELLANRFYELLGVPVLNKYLSNVDAKGKLGVVSDRVKMENLKGVKVEELNKVINNDFTIHSWLANWDFLGMKMENLKVVNGKLMAMDEGGALLFRAQGKAKGKDFAKIYDIESISRTKINKAAFQNMTKEDIRNSARKVAAITDDEIETLVKAFGPTQKKLQKELITKLIGRRDHIIKEYGIKNTEKIATKISIEELMKKSTPQTHKNKITRFKDDLEDKLRMYYSDRAEHAVPTPGAREQAIMKQGQAPGTPLGESLRFIMQFKSFPITVLTRALGRELHGTGAKNLKESLTKGTGDIKGIAHLIVATTIFGYLALVAKDFVKGRKPRDPNDIKTWVAAFTQGGGLGIYGDFMFGEFNRFGRSFTATAAGPTFGQFDDIAELYSRFIRGEDTAAKSVRFLMNNAPFINLFYTRAALDYFILYNIQEMVNPGYLRRLEQRVKEYQGQEFFIPPSSVIRHGGGYR